MGDDHSYFSLLWEDEESCREWRESLYAKDRGYIDDLNLRLVYEEICRAGRFGEQYNFADIFLHPCARVSTVVFRQKIMSQLYQDSFLNEAALEFVSCVSEIQQRLERFDGKAAEKNAAAERVAMAARVAATRKAALTGKIAAGNEPTDFTDGQRDENKKMIAALQIRYEFLAGLESICEKVSGYVKKETPLAECVERLAGFVSDDKVVLEKEELSGFLSALDGFMPHSMLLNKDRGQNCRSVVIDPGGMKECGYTERLMKSAEPFLGKYDFKIRVYQNTDISSLDKRFRSISVLSIHSFWVSWRAYMKNMEAMISPRLSGSQRSLYFILPVFVLCKDMRRQASFFPCLTVLSRGVRRSGMPMT